MNKLKGDIYEVFIRDYIINNLDKPAYLWKDIPEKILIESGIIKSSDDNRLKRKQLYGNENQLMDVGVDILQQDENSFTLVQCKNGYEGGIRIKHLAGFYMMLLNNYNLNGSVYYTSHLSTPIINTHCNEKIKYIKLPFEEPLKVIIKENITPYNYQINALNKIKNHLKTNNKAILSLPCGCGKTFISYLVAQEYNVIIIISPLKQFAKQNLDKYIEYGYDCNKTLLIDSDGTRNIDYVNKIIKQNNNKLLISATYKSVDIIRKIIEKLENIIFIVDEFHNLSRANVLNKDDDFYKLLSNNHKFLLMSATPRIYELENEFNEINKDVIHNNIINLGSIVYKMSFANAIKNKYITDYKIYMPYVYENNKNLIDNINNELKPYIIDETVKSKCIFLFKCLLYNGSKKCIIYCKNVNETIIMIETINYLNKYYLLNLNIQSIISSVSYSNRHNILNIFSNSNNIELLFSVRIMDECIDIPSCDSIYITYPCKSKIRTMQRLCRCIRINIKDKYKVGNVYIWCNEYDDIIETLNGIKEFDDVFNNKITILDNDKSNKNIINNSVKAIKKYILNVNDFNVINWDEQLKIVSDYIIKYNKYPSSKNDSIYIKQLGIWVDNQLLLYKSKTNIMKSHIFRKKWDLFLDNHKKYLDHDSKENIFNINKLEILYKTESFFDKLNQNYIQYKNHIITVIIDNKNKLWVNANHIATTLGYLDIKDAIKRHIDKKDTIQLRYINNNIKINGHPYSLYLNKTGMYSLILSSKLPEANKIKNWITDDVLPSVKKYKLSKINAQNIDNIMDRYNNIIKENKRIINRLKK